jgi:hypothetical protein
MFINVSMYWSMCLMSLSNFLFYSSKVDYFFYSMLFEYYVHILNYYISFSLLHVSQYSLHVIRSSSFIFVIYWIWNISI